MAIRVISTDDGDGGSGDIDGHREKLGGGGCIAEIFDDGWKEERDSIQRAHNSPVHCARGKSCFKGKKDCQEVLTDQTNIDLWVHKSSPNISPLKSVGLSNLLRLG